MGGGLCSASQGFYYSCICSLFLRDLCGVLFSLGPSVAMLSCSSNNRDKVNSRLLIQSLGTNREINRVAGISKKNKMYQSLLQVGHKSL